MVTLLTLILCSASIFSIGGIGEDLGVFRNIFTEVDGRTQIKFALRPEFNVLNENGDLRGLFWTNPFYITLTFPVARGFIVGMGNLERLNQCFDIYYEENDFEIHALGEGGVEEIFLNLSNNFGGGEIALRGSYLFGNASEVWDYSVGEYALIESTFCNYRGKIVSAGLRYSLVSLAYEFLGDVVVENGDLDTTVSLPERLSVSVAPDVFGGTMSLSYEHSFWEKSDVSSYTSPHRLKIGFTKRSMSVYYLFNPWYLSEVTEHGVGISFTTPLRNVGMITFNLDSSLKIKGSVREFRITPQLQLTLEEIFARRR
jgi:hypothetical protein